MHNPIGKLLGNVPYDPREETPPNKSTPVVPQPPGTRFMAYGEEGWDARDLNRAIGGVAHSLDKVVATLFGGDHTRYGGIGPACHVRGDVWNVPVAALEDTFEIPRWCTVSPPLGAHDIATVTKQDPVDQRHALYFDATTHDTARVAQFEDGSGNELFSTINPNDLYFWPFKASVPITGADRYSIQSAGVNWEGDHVIPGLFCRISGSTGPFDGSYQILNTEDDRLELINAYHRLRISSVANPGNWAPGLPVYLTANPSAVLGTIHRVSPTVDWIEVKITAPLGSSFDAAVGVAGGITSALYDMATVDVYEKPGSPVLFESSQLVGAAMATVVSDLALYYRPTARFNISLPGEGAGVDYGIWYFTPNRFSAATPLRNSGNVEALYRETIEHTYKEYRQYTDVDHPALHSEERDYHIGDRHLGIDKYRESCVFLGDGWMTPDRWNIPPSPGGGAGSGGSFEGLPDGELGIYRTFPGGDVTVQFDPCIGHRFETADDHEFEFLVAGDAISITGSGNWTGLLYDFGWLHEDGAVSKGWLRIILDGAPTTFPGATDTIHQGTRNYTIAAARGDQQPAFSAVMAGWGAGRFYMPQATHKCSAVFTGATSPGTYALYLTSTYSDGSHLGVFDDGAKRYSQLTKVDIDSHTRAQLAQLARIYAILAIMRWEDPGGGLEITDFKWVDMSGHVWPYHQDGPTFDETVDEVGYEIPGSTMNVLPLLKAGRVQSPDDARGDPNWTSGGRRFRRRVALGPDVHDIQFSTLQPWGFAISHGIPDADEDLDAQHKGLVGVTPGGGDILALIVSGAPDSFALGDTVTGAVSMATCKVIAALRLRSASGPRVDAYYVKERSGALQIGEMVSGGVVVVSGRLIDTMSVSGFWACRGGGGYAKWPRPSLEWDGAFFYPGHGNCIGYGSVHWPVYRITLKYWVGPFDHGGQFEVWEEVNKTGAGTPTGTVIRVGPDYVDILTDPGESPFADTDDICGLSSEAKAKVDGEPLSIPLRGAWAFKDHRGHGHLWPHVMASVLPDGGRQEEPSNHSNEGTLISAGAKGAFEVPDLQLMGPKKIRRSIPLSSLVPYLPSLASPPLITSPAQVAWANPHASGTLECTFLSQAYYGSNLYIQRDVRGDMFASSPARLRDLLFGLDLPVGVKIVDGGVLWSWHGDQPRAMSTELLLGSIELAQVGAARSQRWRGLGQVAARITPAWEPDPLFFDPDRIHELKFSGHPTPWARQPESGVPGLGSGVANCYLIHVNSPFTIGNTDNGSGIIETSPPPTDWSGYVMECYDGECWLRITARGVPGVPQVGDTFRNWEYGSPSYTIVDDGAFSGVLAPPTPVDGVPIESNRSYYLRVRPAFHWHSLEPAGVCSFRVHQLWVEYTIHDLRC